uniref:NADH-ubiquinone oxidoreductase chain 6 n=1 Tax=Hemicaecilius smithersi TaxID=2597000 RepID=A0A8K1ZFP4_9NEOP|nr:NADH dehydrogenase subunit 6 [Hemicaecilius smithersi]
MYLFFIPIFLLLSLLFFFSVNPLTMGLTLILLTIFISIFLTLSIKSSWFLYMLILIFIGGMLILFIYVTSIFPNEKFIFNQSKTIFFSIFMTLTIIMFMMYLYFLNTNFYFFESYSSFMMKEHLILSPTKKFFSSQTSFMLIFLVNYLFFCMIVVIKITNFQQGPLRKMNYE